MNTFDFLGSVKNKTFQPKVWVLVDTPANNLQYKNMS